MWCKDRYSHWFLLLRLFVCATLKHKNDREEHKSCCGCGRSFGYAFDCALNSFVKHACVIVFNRLCFSWCVFDKFKFLEERGNLECEVLPLWAGWWKEWCLGVWWPPWASSILTSSWGRGAYPPARKLGDYQRTGALFLKHNAWRQRQSCVDECLRRFSFWLIFIFFL